MSSVIVRDDALRDYLAETLDHLSRVEGLLLSLQPGHPAAADLIDACFRAFHTVKGGAGFLHLENLRRIAHAAEHLLEALRETAGPLTPDEHQALLQTVTQLRQQTYGFQGRATTARLIEPKQQVDRLEALSARRLPPMVPGTATGITLEPLERKARDVTRTTERHRFVSQVLDLMMCAEAGILKHPGTQAVEEALRCVRAVDSMASFLGLDPVTGEAREIERRLSALVVSDGRIGEDDRRWLLGSIDRLRLLTVDPYRTGSSRGGESLIRVGMRCIEHLSGLGGSLVARLAGVPGLDRATLALAEELRSGLGELLPVPLAPLCQRIARVVHDAAATLDRKIDLRFSGEDSAVERNLVEGLGEALLHLVRNAVDHGIEPAEIRRRAGKPEAGTLRVNLIATANDLLVTVADDGGGMDPALLRRTAITRGLIAADAELDDQEALHLIFLPGFSTAAAITDISGRGVGMDIVQRCVEQLGGSVEVSSTAGTGTTFHLRIPRRVRG